jgi:pimeloyl-ACP methyl ester carboxylesterase
VFQGEGIELRGWHSAAIGKRRGTLIYLHGVADNRVGGGGIIERFRERGFDVVAYDSRAHGASGGRACTYGYFEKLDLKRAIDTLKPGPVVLLGSSLGAAVALQTAAIDPRISAVVSAEAFSDFRTVATERAPFFFTQGSIDRAFRLAEKEAHFKVDEANPLLAARTITAPVLMIHGADDVDTPPDHAERLFAALNKAKTKKLLMVPGAGHNQSLKSDGVWDQIADWIDQTIP